MTAELLNSPYQLGPLQIWPIHLQTPSAHIYATPPFKSELEVAEVDLNGDGPRVELIQVHNHSNKDFLIPPGWVVGSGLHQVRTFVDAVHVAAHQSVYASVSCVEAGRWSEGVNPLDGGRAPFTVTTAGWEYIPGRNPWRLSHAERQTRVWEQVSKQESRQGIRSTHSLSQIMEEDAEGIDSITQLRKLIARDFQFLPNQHGAIITLDGEPLLMETFSDPDSAKRVLKSTLSALTFDTDRHYFKESSTNSVYEFLEEVNSLQLEHLSETDWAILLAGGNERLHARTSIDTCERVLHSLTINKSNPLLLGV